MRIRAMVDFAESIDGAILETGVIFRDVSKIFYNVDQDIRYNTNFKAKLIRWIY